MLSEVVKLESKQRTPAAPCTRLRSRHGLALEPSPLTPELKEFIDRAIVPALVQRYLAEIDLAETPAPVALSELTSTAATRKVRP